MNPYGRVSQCSFPKEKIMKGRIANRRRTAVICALRRCNSRRSDLDRQRRELDGNLRNIERSILVEARKLRAELNASIETECRLGKISTKNHCLDSRPWFVQLEVDRMIRRTDGKEIRDLDSEAKSEAVQANLRLFENRLHERLGIKVYLLMEDRWVLTFP